MRLLNINNATIEKSTFVNLAGASPHGGGAIVLESTNGQQVAPAVLRDCTIRSSTATLSGGGLSAINMREVSVVNTEFHDNFAA